MMAWYSRERSSFNNSARRSREILYSSAAGLGSAICLLLGFEKTDGSILHHAALAQLSVSRVLPKSRLFGNRSSIRAFRLPVCPAPFLQSRRNRLPPPVEHETCRLTHSWVPVVPPTSQWCDSSPL